MVRCGRVRKLLDAYRRRQLSEAAAIKIEEHLSGCPDCYEEYENVEALFELIQSCSEQVEGSPHFYRALAERVIDQAAVRQRAFPRVLPLMQDWFGAGARQLRRIFFSPGFCACLASGLLGFGLTFTLPATNRSAAGHAGRGERMPDAAGNSTASASERIAAAISDSAAARNGGAAIPNTGDKAVRTAERNAAMPENPQAPLSAAGIKVIQGPFIQPVSMANPSANEAAWIETFDTIQQVKLELGPALEQAEFHKPIRRIEKYLNQLKPAAATPGVFEDFQQGEDALLDHRTGDAMRCFERVLQADADSRLAALASLHLARIYYQEQQFDQALALYKNCIHCYQPFLSGDWKNEALNRIQLLAKCKATGYQALSLYQRALDSAGMPRVEYFRELLHKYPDSVTLPDAIEQLRREALYPDPETETPVSAQTCLNILRQYINEQPKSLYAAQTQLALADILHFRLQNIRQARLEYTRIFEMSVDETLLKAARERLRQTTRLELAEN